MQALMGFQQWCSAGISDDELLLELRQMRLCLDRGEDTITDSFYKDLEFGTGGLRGIMGAGTNRMNIYTVARASQGYVDYLVGERKLASESNKNGEKGEISLVIAYDSRHNSCKFARIAAEIFAASGIRTWLFPELAATPLLSYAIRFLKCSGGVVITASHNPAEYNGYKIYGSDGEQITEEVAGKIFSKIKEVDIFCGVNKADFNQALDDGRICYVEPQVTEAYYGAVLGEAFGGDVDYTMGIVYTPLNGTGLKPVCEVLRRSGFVNISIVEEQKEPDECFTTCPSPNPEKKEALELAIRDAQRLNYDLVLATDPDCDRVGAVVRGKNGYRVLNGHETGALLLDYICRRRQEDGSMPERPIAIKSIVTTGMAEKIGASYGVEIRNILTGFKYIGEQIGELERAGEPERFIFGLEESYGYLSGTYVRDKDGVNASLLIAEMAGYYKKRGKSLEDVLSELYDRYGVYINSQLTHQFPGKSGSEQMQRVMETWRGSAAAFPEFDGEKMVKLDDYRDSRTTFADGSTAVISLPRSNVLTMTWEDGTCLIIRPSGTEPKLKVYVETVGKSVKAAEGKMRRMVGLIHKKLFA